MQVHVVIRGTLSANTRQNIIWKKGEGKGGGHSITRNSWSMQEQAEIKWFLQEPAETVHHVMKKFMNWFVYQQ